MKEINEQSFDMIKKVARNISAAKKIAKGQPHAGDAPNVIGIKLTNRCNLRCKHCYEWNDDGYHHNLSKDYKNADIDIALALKCIKETEKTDAMFYLWGGEPLLYKNMNQLLDALLEAKRYTVICTNGTMLNKYYEKLIPFGDKLELLLALDGDKESHDALRGQGNFDFIMAQIKPLLQLKKTGEFKGVLSVHTMVSNDNIHNFYDTVCYFDSLGIDNLTICLPWYISDETGKEMDAYFQKHFSQLHLMSSGVPSWYAYKYRIAEENYELVERTLRRIRGEKFRINIKFQPDIQGDELFSFLSGSAISHCDKRECFTVFSRADILPNGLVTSCKHFQELSYGNLNENTLSEIWTSPELTYIRKTISEEQMPVCSKCNNLYLHSYKKK